MGALLSGGAQLSKHWPGALADRRVDGVLGGARHCQCASSSSRGGAVCAQEAEDALLVAREAGPVQRGGEVAHVGEPLGEAGVASYLGPVLSSVPIAIFASGIGAVHHQHPGHRLVALIAREVEECEEALVLREVGVGFGVEEEAGAVGVQRVELRGESSLA